MKLNIKTIFLGGLIYYIAQWIVGMVTGVVIHEGILDEAYKSVPQFWRPELNADPPEMGALMPRWIATGLIMSFIATAIYDNINSAFDGSGMVKGFKFGIVSALLYGSAAAGWSGVFNLPEIIWFWWIVEGFFYFAVGGLALGWYVEKYGSR
jgi:hypothetical protein